MSIGGVLVKHMDLEGCVVGGAGVVGFGELVFDKCLKKALWISLKPSVGLKFCSAQK